MLFSPKQEDAIQLIASGQSCIIKGRAGTGKSTLIKEVKRRIEQSTEKNVILTASTGMAALSLDGQTISSLLRLGIYQYSEFEIQAKNRYTLIPENSVLIIDEAYILNVEQLRQIDIALRFVTGVNEKFGGVQIVLTGDDCQLLPFDGELWVDKDFFATLPFVELQHSFRHQDDEAFLTILNQLRKAIQTRDEFNLGLWWDQILPSVEVITDTQKLIIVPYYIQALSINGRKQSALIQDGHDTMILKPRLYGPQPPDAPYDTQILSPGTPVVHLLNRNGLVNGSMGTVFSVDPGYDHVLVNFEGAIRVIGMEEIYNPKTSSGANFIPLLSAFALTSRKVQGLTLKSGVISQTFLRLSNDNISLRRLYSAMSRFTTLKNLAICMY